ncbi:MAG: hypothetical protein AAF125_27035 [Chloroflexota bacterium]
MVGRKWTGVWVGLMALLLAACGGGNAAVPVPGAERYTEDFTSADAWAGPRSNLRNTSFTLEPENGRLRGGANVDGYAWALNTDTHSDVILEAQTRLATDNPNRGYGVACRVQPDGGGYWFLVSRDGYAAILLSAPDGSLVNLAEWRFNAVIGAGGNARNAIRAVCDGENLTMIVNDTRLVSATDDTFTGGTSAVIVSGSSTDLGPTNVIFESVTAWDVGE